MNDFDNGNARLSLLQRLVGAADETDRKKRLFVLMAAPGMMILAGFGLGNILAGNRLGGGFDCLVALALLVSILGVPRLTRPNVVFRLNALLLFAVLCYWAADGGTSGEKVLWVLLYPLMVFFLMGRREGLAWSGAMLVALCLMFGLDHRLPVYAYPWGMKVRVFFVYLACGIMTYAYEIARHLSHNRYATQREKLEAEKQKLAEATGSLQSANAALRKSESLLKHAQTIAQLGNWEYDYRTRKFWWSDEIFNIFGMEGRDGYVTMADFQKLVADIDDLQARMADQLQQADYLDIELDGLRPNDQTVLHLHARAELTRDQQGRAARLTGVLQDITAREAYEAERRELRERLARSQKMEAIGLLAGGVAHDLNNVMLGIVSYPDFLLSQMDPQDPLYTPLKTICDSGQKAAAIVEDLLTLARRGVTTTALLDFNTVIEEYLHSPEFEKLRDHHPGVRFNSRLDRDPLHVRGSAQHLKRTVMNLVSNAAEAIERSGTVSITTANCSRHPSITQDGGETSGGCVRLRVEDDGSGIAKEDLERIFEPFYTKKIMGRSGTGLGMAVAWGAVQDHDGHIDVHSEPGRGTRIDVYLPAAREAPAQQTGAPPRLDYAGKGETILIVDDVSEQRQVAGMILNNMGYATRTVGSGEEAVAYLKQNKVDLLLLDMIMEPGMDGLDTYRAVLEIHPHQKAIIVSGFSETDRIRTAQALGAGAFLKKPYRIEALGMAVRSELDR
jgi:signal transduction histidine kinase/CheY-like chemotaxis protein